MPTDTTEKGLETLIVRSESGTEGLGLQSHHASERQTPYGAASTRDTCKAAERLPDEEATDTTEDAAEFNDEVETIDEEITE